MDFSENYKTCYQYVQLFSDPILTMAILFMISLICPFTINWKSIQYNACLAIAGAIWGTSKEKLYQELGLKSLQLRRWYRKLGMFYKIYKNKNTIPAKPIYILQETWIIFRFKIRHNVFKNFLSFYNYWMEQFRSYPPELKKFCWF